ncbi:hypothetical protein TAL182_PD00151 (plasmid) [Rhizobium sp. TAL182]|nr:hypothetical protein TAL182_PD00151 [Rhizobium sp. TAL182]
MVVKESSANECFQLTPGRQFSDAGPAIQIDQHGKTPMRLDELFACLILEMIASGAGRNDHEKPLNKDHPQRKRPAAAHPFPAEPAIE